MRKERRLGRFKSAIRFRLKSASRIPVESLQNRVLRAETGSLPTAWRTIQPQCVQSRSPSELSFAAFREAFCPLRGAVIGRLPLTLSGVQDDSSRTWARKGRLHGG